MEIVAAAKATEAQMAAGLVCSIVVLPRISRDGTIFLQRSTTLVPVQAAVRATNLIEGKRQARIFLSASRLTDNQPLRQSRRGRSI
jgi:hypothetical protein